ncbi:TIGR00725 family protein [Halobellus sp. H-GB7]|uniref:TIGR00725 family protein n=1 Tax=Halobellus sp. H-GB7 TaxID=3069756 RepID=UPI0027B77FAF|nr:TIGR00725 family protein [Halobellus sp. H-GB7]MDQ2053297.1 TIGR00725 family protein [Halobellus sp. H-GB7]
MRISVIGGSTIDDDTAEVVTNLGRHIAQRGHTVVCGGLGGVMEAVCRGADEAGGHTIGILPTDDRADANSFVDEVIATGLGHARNALVVMNGDAVVAVDGSGGTLSELGYAAVYERPTAGIGTHDANHVEAVETAERAVEYVENAVAASGDSVGDDE